MIQYAAIFIFPFIMLSAAISDLLTMKISNSLSLGLFAAFLVMAFLTKMPMSTFLWSVGCGLAILVVTFGMFAMGWVGGGDAKLVSATAVWMGWSLLAQYLLVASVFGGVLTIVLLMFRRFPLPAFLVRQDWLLRLHEPKGGIPYGVALAASGLMFYPSTQIWLAASGV